MAAPEQQRSFKFGWSLFRHAHQAIARRCHRESHKTMDASRHDVHGEPGPDPTETAPTSPIARSHEEAGILTDAEWERVSELLREQKPGQGRPRRDDRQVLCRILWVLDTGASWRELPEEEFGPNSTVHRRYRKWCKEGLWGWIVQALGRE
jgi:Putative transposase of IS4/5 family (DUF4096)